MTLSFRFNRLLLITLVIALCVSSSLLAQVTTTGAVSGTVRTPDGVGVPGVAVTATSPALQGERVGYSGDNGDYIVRGLPPGQYKIRFEMAGMQSISRDVRVDLGGTTRLDVAMSPTMTAEAITVTAAAPAALETTQLGTNFKKEEIGTLPLPRTLAGIAALAPGVNTNTFNAGQVRINGGFAYDNVFLVDGTDINDNLFGTAHNLFIEESIEETQVLTGGVSPEYGRFTGGVINVITKSGGNEFAGTFRADLTNPDWVAETPIEKSQGIEHVDQMSEIYSATLGGPVMRDRLWFFLAGRKQETSQQLSLVETNIPYQFGVENPRYEVKLTGNIAARHTLQASWLDNETTQSNNIQLAGRTMDPRTFVTRTLPNDRWAAFYNGILSTNLFAEVKYSEKTFGFRNSGGTSTDIHDSPFLTRTGPSRHYNAPYFDSNDPEDRNNEDLSASLSYFLSTGMTGSHDLKGGFEEYTSTRTGGNSQSATGFVWGADFKRNADGKAAVDAQGRYIPLFIPSPNTGFTVVTNWIPIRGAQVDLTTTSFYINDHWTPNRYLSLNLGARFEIVEGEATGGITTVDTDRLTPRMAASWDVRGDGRYKVDATYAQYSGKYNERQFARNTNVGIPNSVSFRYIGPRGEGVNFEPGFDINNYEITGGSFPLQNVFVRDDIEAPIVDEWTLSGGMQIGRLGFAKLTYTTRDWSDFYEDFIDPTTGFTEVVITPTIRRNFDNLVIGNTNAMEREYEAIQLLAQFKLLTRWNMHVNYTHELTNDGNFVGEAGNQPGNASLFGDYPEMFTPERHFPKGRLPGFQEHRLRFLNTYNLSLGAFGDLDLGLIYGYDSPTTYSLAVGGVARTAQQTAAVNAAGYKSPPTSQTIYFGELGVGEFNEVHQLDFALTYGIPIFRTIEPWVKVDIYNLTNEDTLQTFDTTISVDPNSPKDALGLPTGFIRGARFGQATSANNYQQPREYRIAAGIRF